MAVAGLPSEYRPQNQLLLRDKRLLPIQNIFPSNMCIRVCFSFLLLHSVLLFCNGFHVPEFLGNETDRVALLEFKSEITHDPLDVLASWNESVHFCKWHGVTCSRRHRQRVIMLNLKSLNLAGSISPHIGNLSFLKVLKLQNNGFTHEIPSEIGCLRRLQVLALHNNSIGGGIPSNMSRCSNLVEIYLSHNLLVGKIPSELSSLPKIEVLHLDSNNLTGSIPSSLGNLSCIQKLFLGDNKLDGSIPDSVGSLKNLEELSLAENRFSGTLPSSIFNISSLVAFDVGVNRVQGGIPLDFGFTLPNLLFLSLGFNQITGVIPSSMFNASKLEVFQVTSNNLTGEVPSLEKLQRLTVFRIATNSLGSGGHHDLNFLCSLTNATSLKHLDINNNNFGGLLPGCICNFSITLETLILNSNKIFGSIPAGIGKFINLQTLHMWDNQLSANQIGTGSFGSVYKGILDEGKTIIAVKVLNLLHHGASKSFIAECSALRNIRHRNLVKILTVCSGVDYKGDDFKALVYEFMHNGSLEEWLHPVSGADKTVEAPKRLNFLQRINIAIDVACALKYLHHDCQPATAHCDIKPSNVLLDHEMTAHVADFGLAKLLPPAHLQTSSIGVKGTIGYIAPAIRGRGKQESTTSWNVSFLW